MNSSSKSQRFAGVILAGGGGARLGGVDKSQLRINNQTLLRRMIGNLPDEIEKLYVVSPRAHELVTGWVPEKVTGQGSRQVKFLQDSGRGPAMAMLSALDALARDTRDRLARGTPEIDYILTCAVDTFEFPEDFMQRAAPLLLNNDVVQAKFGADIYPTNAVWKFEPLRSLSKDFLHAADRDEIVQGPSFKAICAKLKVVALDYAPLTDRNPFFNINTMADLIAAQRASQHWVSS